MLDDSDTQKLYSTDVGYVDWARASAAAQGVVCGNTARDNYTVLEALFRAALAGGRVQKTSAGPVDAGHAHHLLTRLRTLRTNDDADMLWSLLFALFEVKRRA